jgi:endonuclease/exonuclease/phosphatase (EEP) superfamily protein YafD
MLQEVPPGAISALSSETGMQAVSVRTGPFLGGVSLRARLGAWNPDLWRTHEGNANVILVGRGWRVVPGSVRSARLNPPKTIACAARRAALNRAEIIEWASESRRVVAAIIRGPGGERVLVACLHCTTNARVSHVEIGRARDLVVKWAGDLPIVLAGDFNVGPAHAGMQLLEAVGLREEVPDVGIDHIFVRGGTSLTARRWSASERDIAVRTGTQTARLRLSDHDPVEATIALDDVPSS